MGVHLSAATLLKNKLLHPKHEKPIISCFEKPGVKASAPRRYRVRKSHSWSVGPKQKT